MGRDTGRDTSSRRGAARRSGAWRIAALAAVAALAALLPAGSAEAKHSWNDYHWERATSDPLTVDLGDNLGEVYALEGVMGTVASDWTASAIDTPAVAGTAPAECTDPLHDGGPTYLGRVEVCHDSYGRNGWLGIARIWLSADGSGHIVSGVAAMNDSYLGPGGDYDDPLARLHVTCQEVGHTIGLDHQGRPHDRTCMNDRWGLTHPDYAHPNQHDYDQLATIYTHDHSSTDDGGGGGGGGNGGGRGCEKNGKCHRETRHETRLPDGRRVVTWILWA